jgi:protein PhnA
MNRVEPTSGESLLSPLMSKPACPMCEMTDVLEHPDKWECMTCGHEWERDLEPEKARVIKDAHGNVLADGDCVILIKDLPLKGAQVLKGGSKSKPIRLVEGDHEIDCKVDGIAVGLKACFVKKA